MSTRQKARESDQQFVRMKNSPDALFVTNEVMTTGTLLALSENNVRIPEEIAIVEFDDPAWAPLVRPALTAVRQPSYSVGTTASAPMIMAFLIFQRRIIKAITLGGLKGWEY